jgi:hypothetical protein
MDKRYEAWAHAQATPGFVELTAFPTIACLQYSGDDLDEVERKAQEAKNLPEVVAASVRVVVEED